MKHGSLFSGIGGFDLAAEWMGWEKAGNRKEGAKEKQPKGCGTGSNWERSEICASRVYGMANGVPDWMDRNQALGNAIVPQVALEIFKVIDQMKT